METIQVIASNLGTIGGMALQHLSIVAVAVGGAILLYAQLPILRNPAFDVVTLKDDNGKDDKGYFPAYAVAPVVRADVPKAHPDLADLHAVSARLNDKGVAAQNAKVDMAKVPVENVAAEVLEQNGMI